MEPCLIYPEAGRWASYLPRHIRNILPGGFPGKSTLACLCPFISAGKPLPMLGTIILVTLSSKSDLPKSSMLSL
ncbi:hypothetical protein BDZ94DRAFT_1245250 [Collybia nuda]|uniref:Uncharacterized protein n=1 Tax=Collybia nuda TaxID=64659 RepID=A0A9P5YI37_9AGAR|nr:hypothetical protein BDZ94DRAFT_1245250 [Collybia nuda]